MTAENYAEGGGNVNYWPRPLPLRIQHSHAAKWRKALENNRLRLHKVQILGEQLNWGSPLGLLHILSITWLWKNTGSSVGPLWASLATVNISGHHSWDRPYTTKSISFIQQTQYCLCHNIIFKGSSGFIELVSCWKIKKQDLCLNLWLFGLAAGSLQFSREKKLHHLYVVELRCRPSILRQSKKKNDTCDKVTLKALMLQREVCVISYSYASLLKVSREILSSLKPSGYSLTSLIPSVLKAKEKMRSCKINERSCRPVKSVLVHTYPACTGHQWCSFDCWGPESQRLCQGHHCWTDLVLSCRTVGKP